MNNQTYETVDTMQRSTERKRSDEDIIDTEIDNQAGRSSKPRKRKGMRQVIALFVFTLLWSGLVYGGLYLAKQYAEQLRTSIQAELEQQTATQIAQMQADYTQKITSLNEQYQIEMDELSTRIETLNQLLTFVQDNASSNTDNSNQLYTQLNEVKEQLKQLKKNLEVLQ